VASEQKKKVMQGSFSSDISWRTKVKLILWQLAAPYACHVERKWFNIFFLDLQLFDVRWLKFSTIVVVIISTVIVMWFITFNRQYECVNKIMLWSWSNSLINLCRWMQLLTMYAIQHAQLYIISMYYTLHVLVQSSHSWLLVVHSSTMRFN